MALEDLMALGRLVGKKVLQVFMNDNYLRFVTDRGDVTFRVESDCCSSSYFYDFIGVRKLIDNGPVIEVGVVDLYDAGSEFKPPEYDSIGESLACYGYSITTENPVFGEQTSVFSFRNSSNGYYGGWMEDSDYDGELPELVDDVVLGSDW